MKKVSPILSVAAACMVLMTLGFYLLRSQGSSSVRIYAYESPTSSTLYVENTAPAETISYPIDINTADVASLMTLPGIGPTFAQRIVEYRETHGQFTDLTELLNIPGIGQKRLDAILEYITIGGSHENTGC